MPTYNFRDTTSGDVIEKFMSISAREEFLKENPQYETMITGAPMLVDPMRVGIRKRDTGFKDVLQQIHERTPGSDLKKMNAF
jgi:hypothetical protein